MKWGFWVWKSYEQKTKELLREVLIQASLFYTKTMDKFVNKVC